MENDFNHTKVEVTTDHRGNGLFATKKAEPGDELLRINSPLVAIPEAEVLDSVCYHCFTDSSVASLKKCTGCNITSYCSKNCQRDSWKLVHKLECQILEDVGKKQKGQRLVTAVRAVMQILLKKKNVIEKHKDDRSWQQVGLVDHLTEMKSKDPARYDGLLLQSIAAKEFSKVEADVESVVYLFARIEMNGFRIHQGDNTSLGLCFAPEISMANHSCTPNTYVSFTGRQLSLRALVPIQVNSEILISYIDPSFPLPTREAELSRYYFICRCNKCASNWDNYTTCLKTSLPSNSQSSNTALVSTTKSKLTSLLTPSETEKLLTTGIDFITNPTNAPILTTAQNQSTTSSLSSLPKLTTLFSSTPAIQPLPSLLHTLYLHHLHQKDHLSALTTILFTCFRIDPILYPQHQHPTRVIHIYIATKLIQEILFSQHENPAPNPTGNPVSARIEAIHREMDYVRCVHALLVLLDRVVDRSYGKGSRWAREVREMLGEVRQRPMGLEDREMEGGSERGEGVLRACFGELRGLAGCVGDVIEEVK